MIQNPKFPQLSNIKINELSFSPTSLKPQRTRMPLITKYLRHKNAEIVKKFPKSPISTKISSRKAISKIDTNRKIVSSSLDYQEVRFESVKWSGASILHPGFFNLPMIKNTNMQHNFFNTPEKIRNKSQNKFRQSIEEVDEKEIIQSNSRIPQKFMQNRSPWTFQSSNYITPNDG